MSMRVVDELELVQVDERDNELLARRRQRLPDDGFEGSAPAQLRETVNRRFKGGFAQPLLQRLHALRKSEARLLPCLLTGHRELPNKRDFASQLHFQLTDIVDAGQLLDAIHRFAEVRIESL